MGITWDAGNPAGAYIHGEGSHGILAVQLVPIHMGWDHMGFWQSSWWDSGSPAGGCTHGVGMMGYGAGMRGGGRRVR